MANIIVVKDMSKALEEHDPFLWKCDSCGKKRKYTQEDFDTTHKPWPDPEKYDYAFFITCPFLPQRSDGTANFCLLWRIFRRLDRQITPTYPHCLLLTLDF
jgi:hypothetical protein